MKLCTDRRTQPEAFQVQGTISTSNAQILIPGHKTRTALWRGVDPDLSLLGLRVRSCKSRGIRCCCWWWWEPSATPPGRKAIAAYREILARPFFFFVETGYVGRRTSLGWFSRYRITKVCEPERLNREGSAVVRGVGFGWWLAVSL